MGDEVTSVKSTRGGDKLVHNEFMYTEKKRSAINIWWVCAERCKHKCKGSAKTLINRENPQVSLNLSHDFFMYLLFTLLFFTFMKSFI